MFTHIEQDILNYSYLNLSNHCHPVKCCNFELIALNMNFKKT